MPVVRTPIDVTLCVPELVGPDAPAECADGVRAMYKAWSASLDVDVPEPIVDFLCHAECPKDLRMAAALMWARRHVPRWRAYADDVMPTSYTSLYLATDEELEALQDENVRRMAMGSKANYAAGWEMIKTQHPTVADAIDGAPTIGPSMISHAGGIRLGAGHRAHARDERQSGGRTVRVHRPRRRPRQPLLRAQLPLRRVPGWRIVSTDVGHHGDEGDAEGPAAARARRRGADLLRREDAQRAADAPLRVHGSGESKRAAPDGCMIPGARKIRAKTVSAAGRAFAEEGDTKAEWAARQMMQMANPVDDSADKAADLACVGAMRGAADAKLASFPTTAEEDEATLSAGELGERMGMCVEYRLSVKRNVEAFRRFLAKMEEVVE